VCSSDLPKTPKPHINKILKHNKYILIKTTKYGLRRIEIR